MVSQSNSVTLMFGVSDGVDPWQMEMKTKDWEPVLVQGHVPDTIRVDDPATVPSPWRLTRMPVKTGR
jgi:hypothetical protein